MVGWKERAGFSVAVCGLVSIAIGRWWRTIGFGAVRGCLFWQQTAQAIGVPLISAEAERVFPRPGGEAGNVRDIKPERAREGGEQPVASHGG